MNKQNPFPGMNPFMEQSWPDIHVRLISYTLEALGSSLPDDLQAKGEADVIVSADKDKRFRPDIAITEDSWKQGIPPKWSPVAQQEGINVTEPAILMAEDVVHRWVEVRTDSGDLVTVIEVISPSNKMQHRKQYLEKRMLLLNAGVNVVEIDLLRAGERIVNVHDTSYEWSFRSLGERHYTTCVTRGMCPEQREVYATGLMERLPTIRVPLRETDTDVALPLQDLIDRCYTTGRYWKLDYALSSVYPPLTEEEASWATERLALLKEDQ